MDDFARLPAEERDLYFNETAGRMGLPPLIIEKDFWVCWMLGKLFALPDIGPHLTFKGGTSLSKVYRAISRFSEDIDISIDRSCLGIAALPDPKVVCGYSKTRREKLGDALDAACASKVTGSIMQPLTSLVGQCLGEEEWLRVESAKRLQTVFFYYPTRSTSSGYVKPFVKIEFMGKADGQPSTQATIQSYVSQQIAGSIAKPKVNVKVLAAERTFWEKVTLLHDEFSKPEETALTPRISRHIYDLWDLGRNGVAPNALQRTDILELVASNKQAFFARKWSRYDLATPGSLRVFPPENRHTELTHDYKSMSDMFIGNPPPFEELLHYAQELETAINSVAPPELAPT